MVVNGQYAPAPSAHFRRWSIILFGTPTLYLNRWNTIWVDRVTYTREWRKLVKEITEEWVSGMAAVSFSFWCWAMKLISQLVARGDADVGVGYCTES